MRDDYDFSEGKRGALLPATGKSRITIMLDEDVLAFYRDRAEVEGLGYQTLINQALRATLPSDDDPDAAPLTAATLRQILREELHAS